MTDNRDSWQPLLSELQQRSALAEAMGGADRVARQRERGRLNARERIAGLCDPDSFSKYGSLAGGNHPAAGAGPQ